MYDGKGDPNAKDPIDQLDGHPNFLGIIYPGQPREIQGADWVPPSTFPPSFLLCAANDPGNPPTPTGIPRLYNILRAGKVPVELHIFEEGAHGFGVRQWSYSVSGWPNLFLGWMNDRNLLKKSTN